MIAARSSKYRWQKRLVPAVWSLCVWRWNKRGGAFVDEFQAFAPITPMPSEAANQMTRVTRWRVVDVVQITILWTTTVSRQPKNWNPKKLPTG
jgi:hypothetical protein